MATNNPSTFIIFGLLVLGLFGIIVWASLRTRTASEFFTAGRSISAFQNGLAIAGDFMSAGTFLGTSGLLYLYGFDGTLILVAALFGFLPLLFLLAERLRNAGAFTLADVLTQRFGGTAVRGATALTTLVVSVLYLLAQLVGAGAILQILSGWSFTTAVAVTGGLMTIYVAFGGMLGATWMMIVKAIILFLVGLLMCVLILAHSHGSFAELLATAASHHPKANAYLGPGLLLPADNTRQVIDIISYGLVYMLGTVGLPHILIRFFTVRDSNAARRSLGWAMGVMGLFFLMVIVIGVGARALLTGDLATQAATAGGNLVPPILAGMLGGGPGSIMGDIAMAFVAGVAFLTILAVVSGLLISASGAVAHDLWAQTIWRNRPDLAKHEPVMARATTVVLGVVATGLAMAVGPNTNITFLLGLAFLVAASANLPVLILSLYWSRFTARGAIVGLIGGLLVSLVVIVLSPTIMGANAIIPLRFPAIISMPLGLLLCWLGTIIGSATDKDKVRFDRMIVRSEVGALLGEEA